MNKYASSLSTEIKEVTIPTMFAKCLKNNNCSMTDDYYNFSMIILKKHDVFDFNELLDIVVNDLLRNNIKCEYNQDNNNYVLNCKVMK